jgi:hypothetical protein
VKALVVLAAAVAALLSFAAGRAAGAAPVWAGQCGIPVAQPVWTEFAWPTLLPIFGKPGVTVAVTSGTDYPQQARAAGAAIYYFDLNMKKKTGLPTTPTDPSTIAAKAQTEYDFAVAETGCQTPVIAENELYGAGTATPWTPSNAQYRANVLSLLQDLAAKGAHPVLLVNSTPFTSGDALGWWLAVSKVADIIREVYVPATQVWKAGPLLGNRMLRQHYRSGLAEFTSIGIPANRLGIFVSFSAIKGGGGRNGLEPASAWFQVAKWMALSAKTVAAETGAGSIWSWGWQMWAANELDPDKAHAACVWLWTRSPTLCDAPRMLGPKFDTSLTDGQISLPPGAICSIAGGGSITAAALGPLEALTGDRDAAMSALFERSVESSYARPTQQEVLAAEQAVIRGSFGGSRRAYDAALARAHASVAVARAILADELRRAVLEDRLPAGTPQASDVETFYSSYPQLQVRLVHASPAPPWLGGRTQGLAISDVAPDALFSLPPGKKTTIVTLDGSYTVRALAPALPLGAVALSSARTAIAAALRSFARGQAFEAWTIARQHGFLNRTTCLRDQLPQPASVDLVEYLPFLRLAG